MRLHAGVGASATASACRALVGGFGRPGRRDLDFGEKFVRYAEALEWPDGVVVEDLSYAAPLVLHRLQELRPAKLVLVGAVSRGADPPGTIRRYRLDPSPPSPEDVHAGLAEAVGGDVGIDHTLAVVRHWGCLPHDTVVVEVEAADSSFGLGFSEQLAAAMDELLETVREELGDGLAVDLEETELAAALDAVASSSPPSRGGGGAAAVAASGGLEQLFEYADAHAHVRSLEALSERLPPVPGLALAARFHPATRVMRTSGNWYDVVPLDDGGVAVVVGDVPGHGVEAASRVTQLRTAVRAFALLEGHSPARIVEHVERFSASLGSGRAGTLVYLTVDGRGGEAVLCNAGHPAPLLLTPDGHASFLDVAGPASLGTADGGPRREAAIRVVAGSTLLLFTDGLVRSTSRTVEEGLRRVRDAAVHGPRGVEALCDHVLEACLEDHERGEDVSLLAVRVGG